mgnify:CR=1 FL=1
MEKDSKNNTRAKYSVPRRVGETQMPESRLKKQQQTLLTRLEALGEKTDSLSEVAPKNFIDSTLSGIKRTVQAVQSMKNSDEIKKHKASITKLEEAIIARKQRLSTAKTEAGDPNATEWHRKYSKNGGK